VTRIIGHGNLQAQALNDLAHLANLLRIRAFDSARVPAAIQNESSSPTRTLPPVRIYV
jgi:hypothetical protein